MLASLISNLHSVQYWLENPWWALISIFQLWMLIDAVRRREWLWALFIGIGWGLSAVLYYLFVYRAAASASATQGFELPGAFDRRRIKELQAQIHYLDKAHHYSQLGDLYFQQGKLDRAEASYRAALERDAQDIDTRAHLGQCLLREKRPAEARPLLEGVVAENPKHDYGYTQMALAETLSSLGQADAALVLWREVTEGHSYPRAKVQLAELYLARNETGLARAQLEEVLADDAHGPAFQRKRDRVWIRRARSLLRKIG
ncbi:MAG TPA: tetratricopeptide repeat protein [Candidatus Acidoferrum sp.]|nr:tetratricopeptide repeat protein [Candidatus Acidoferrum sp.]